MAQIRLPYDLRDKRGIKAALAARAKDQEMLFAEARWARHAVFGDKAEIRSVIEYSNICAQACNYCGMNRYSTITRYTMPAEEAMRQVSRLYGLGRRVIMFQTGECPSDNHFLKLCSILSDAKRRFSDLSLICCLGNLAEHKYRMLRDIGVERYILKFETSDARLYNKVKPSDTLKNRLSHIHTLKKLGFQVSSGNIVGLPGQTTDSLADDLMLLKDLDLPMGSSSVFIPNELSNFAGSPRGDVMTALNFMAILRIACPEMLIPTTSSMELFLKGGQSLGLMAGANSVTLHDGTPVAEENSFVIYRKNRYKPKNALLAVGKKAGLYCLNTSLIRDKEENSLYHKLVLNNVKGGRVAIIADGRSYTYKDIHGMVLRFSSFLRSNGLRERDVVLLALLDSIEFVVSFLACIRLGITAGCIDPVSGKKEIKRALGETGASYVLGTDNILKSYKSKRTLKISEESSSGYFLSLIRKYREDRKAFAPDHNNPAIILFTSGTTGYPKGVIHTYKNIFLETFPRQILKMSPSDRIFSCSRMYTSFGLGNSLLFPFHRGSSVMLTRELPNPNTIEKLTALKPTLFFAVPSMYNVLLKYHTTVKKLSRNVRLFIASGEKLRVETFTMWRSRFGKPLLECYGSTEMCHSFISNIPGEERAGTCGIPLEGFSLRFGQNGRMWYSGHSLFPRYASDEKLTRGRLVDGWFRSDDIGRMDRRGYVFFEGRDNTVVKVSGKWVYLTDIEEKLMKYPVVAEAAVIKRQEGLECFVSLSRRNLPLDPENAIRKFCSRRMEVHELPSRIRILQRLPKTRTGKIDRKRLEKLP